MAKSRYTGKSGVLEIDADGGGTPAYTAAAVVRNIQLPPETKARIDVGGMDDTNAETRPGLPEESEFSFEMAWDYATTLDADLRTAMTNDSLSHFKAEVTDGTTTQTTTWSGYITDLEPLAYGGNDPVAMRVIGVRSGAITEAVA